jgi:D-serine deaminase-like pyridoxal phosphate-dependent protein
VGQNRTGIVPGPEASRLYARIAATPGLTVGGLHAYDGHLHDPDHARLVAAAEAAFAPVWRLRDELITAGLPVPRIVASGTPTFPILAARGDVEVGAGTTMLWDAGQPVTSPDLDFLHAAVLLARVVSRPASGRLCLDLGHKSVASEMPHPRVAIFGLEDAACVGHNEEHMVLETPRADAFPVGTVVYALPRHVCPTVALHEEVVVVRDGRAAERWHVAARRRRITV